MNPNESKGLIKIATDIICDTEALNIFCELSIAKKKELRKQKNYLDYNTHYHLFTSQISFQNSYTLFQSK